MQWICLPTNEFEVKDYCMAKAATFVIGTIDKRLIPYSKPNPFELHVSLLPQDPWAITKIGWANTYVYLMSAPWHP
jgi:hypothetical protein